MSDALKAIVLAAGKGTRLRTEGIDLPKVLRLAGGRPLLDHVLDQLSFLPRQDIVLVVGYEGDKVVDAFPSYPHVFQSPQLGTGHAVQCAEGALKDFDGHILICCGDTPLMPRSAYQALWEQHLSNGDTCTVLAAVAGDPTGYGRIIRDEAGNFSRIVEEKDASPEEKAVKEVNTGVFLFQARELWRSLTTLRPNNAQGEYYLTDAPLWLLKQGAQVGVCAACTAEDMLGVNTPEQLAQVEHILQERKGEV